MTWWSRNLCCLAFALLAAEARGAPPTSSLQEVRWLVHVDLIDAGAGRDLDFFEGLIEGALFGASQLLEGNQGPADTPCCARVELDGAVTTFGSPGDGLDVIDSMADQDAITALSVPGTQAFLVDSLTFCGGPAPVSVGCATTPFCSENQNPNSELWVVLSLDALEGGKGAQTLAHEIGHTACLTHVDVEECQLMRSGSGGGCLDASECANILSAFDESGGVCSCHDDVSESILPDLSSCSEMPAGLCSGGICANPAGPGSSRLLAAAGPGFGAGEATDDALLISGLTGGWSRLGSLGSSDEAVQGLAYAIDSETLYGVVPSPADDLLVVINPDTGSITQTLGTISNGSKELIALAYDPGNTNAADDDLLVALETDGSFEDVVTIDPQSPDVTNFVGALEFGAPNGFRGLAYDSATETLYTSSPFAGSIYEIDLDTCPFFCGLIQRGASGLVRGDTGLAYSADTGLLHLLGSQLASPPLGPRTLYDVIDPTTFTKVMETIQVDSFTTGGLAVIPPPVAAAVPTLAPPFHFGLLALLVGTARQVLQRRRSQTSQARPIQH